MQTIQLQMAKAQGVEAHQRSVRAILRRLRTQRRVRRMADESGGLMSDFDRGTFLLAKQLMYFERYGRMFVSEVPILNDRAFIAQLLAGVDLEPEPGDRRAGAPGTKLKSVLVSAAGPPGPADTGRCHGRGGGDLHAPTTSWSTPTCARWGRWSGPSSPALRDGKVVGIRGTGGAVIVPPTEYDPETGEETAGVVEVGPEGTVTTWSWVAQPRPKHPLRRPSPGCWSSSTAPTPRSCTCCRRRPDAVSTGMRVRPEFVPEAERVGHVKDIRPFVAVGGAS